MPSSAEGKAHAFDATVSYAPGTPEAHADYLGRVADDAESAVGLVEQTIADLKETLTERRAAAKAARAEHSRALKNLED